MQITDEMVDAALRIRDTAMKQTLAARIPESGHFGAIAQDADWLVDALTAALAKAWRPVSEAPHGQLVLLGWRDWRDGTWCMEVGCASHGRRTEAGSSVSYHGSATDWQPLTAPPATKEAGEQ